MNNIGSLVFDETEKKVPFYKKKKFLIIAGISIAFGLILAGVLSFVLVTQLADNSRSPTIPKNYAKY